MGHHRFIKVTMAVWLIDPSTEPATSGPPDEQVAKDLAGKTKQLKASGGRGGKAHNVMKSEVISTESTTTPPPP